MKNDPYPKNIYNIFAQIQGPSSTCPGATSFAFLADSEILPTLAITAGEEGVIVAYSTGAYYRGVGAITASYVARLHPITLILSKRIRMYGGYSPPGCVAGGPGSLEVAQVSIVNHSDVILQGGMGGNSICAITEHGAGPTSLGCTPCDGTGVHRTSYSATFAEFFTGGQPAAFTTY